MPLKTTEAITLRTYPYRESDCIAVFFTRTYGKVRAIARAARHVKSRFGSALEPMSYVRVIFFEKENRDLASVQSCDLLQSHAVHRSTLEGTYYTAYFAELLGEFVQEGQANERAFRLALTALSTGSAAQWEIRARYLETWLLRLEGVLPALDQCARCGESLSGGPAYLPGHTHEALCKACSQPADSRLGTVERSLISDILARSLAAGDWTRWKIETVKNLGRLNSKLIQYHLEKPLKSQRFLKDLQSC